MNKYWFCSIFYQQWHHLRPSKRSVCWRCNALADSTKLNTFKCFRVNQKSTLLIIWSDICTISAHSWPSSAKPLVLYAMHRQTMSLISILTRSFHAVYRWWPFSYSHGSNNYDTMLCLPIYGKIAKVNYRINIQSNKIWFNSKIIENFHFFKFRRRCCNRKASFTRRCILWLGLCSTYVLWNSHVHSSYRHFGPEYVMDVGVFVGR